MIQRRDLLEIYQAALRQVNGRTAVRKALRLERLQQPFDLIAIGKAAAAMAAGVLDELNDQVQRGLVITKHGHLDSGFDARFRCIESDHPVPGPASLQAGRELLAFCKSMPPGRAALFCLSGGASSLVEVLPAGMTLADLQKVNQVLLGSGLAIDRVNAIRCRLSLLKGGRLATILGQRSTRVLLISDVPGDNPAVIGSGLLHLPDAMPEPEWPGQLEALRRRFSVPPPARFAAIPHSIVANQSAALQAAAKCAKNLQYHVHRHSRFLDGEVSAVAQYLAEYLQSAARGVHLWGGETVVKLPDNPGRGGRNQQLALAIAVRLRGIEGILLLAAGSDGSDGPTEDAGAIIDAGSCERGEAAGLNAESALSRFDAGHFLQASGDLVSTGPTGTNVMDFMLAIKC